MPVAEKPHADETLTGQVDGSELGKVPWMKGNCKTVLPNDFR